VGGTGVLSALLSIALVLLLVACRGPATATGSDLQLTLRVEPAPAQAGNAILVVTVTDGNDQPVDEAVVDVEGNMTHPGMVPVTARVEGGAGGEYRLPFTWSMGGDWVVTVTARLADGRQARADFPVSVEGD
jgi:hypothetical protein